MGTRGDRITKIVNAKKAIQEACDGAFKLIEGIDPTVELNLSHTLTTDNYKVRIDLKKRNNVPEINK